MSRMQEMKQGKMCHDAIPERITKITNFLNEREKNGDTIYVVSDWHLFKRVEKGKTLCKKRHNFNEIINNYKNTVKDKDAVILVHFIKGTHSHDYDQYDIFIHMEKDIVLTLSIGES